MATLQDKVCQQRQRKASAAMAVAQAQPVYSEARNAHEREGYHWLEALRRAQHGDLTPMPFTQPEA